MIAFSVFVFVGSVYVYAVVSSVFSFRQKITAFDDGTNNALDAFGFSVSVHRNTFAVSASFDDDGGNDAGLLELYVDTLLDELCEI